MDRIIAQALVYQALPVGVRKVAAVRVLHSRPALRCERVCVCVSTATRLLGEGASERATLTVYSRIVSR